MRLLHTTALRFAEFNDGDTPPYAVLSHRWKDGELSHDDFLHGRRKDSQGHHKVVEACRLAKSRSRDYIWIDSICIDKKSSAELSEAINAMFAWYKAAVECYAYLSDVNWTNLNVANSRDSGQSGHSGSSEVDLLGKSRWFTRGWTLQELLAPKQVLFYDSNWHFMGTKVGLAPMLSQVTGIDIEVLRHPERLFQVNVAQRMSWASQRQTTRSEDIAYCLLGIFDVHMALLYGEGGKKAFFRLQLEIIKSSNDDSIFAWTDDELPISGMLAPWPSAFASSGDIRTFARPQQRHQRPWTWTNLGLELWIPDFETKAPPVADRRRPSFGQRSEPPQDTLFGRDVETFTLTCWKSKKPGEDAEHKGWRWRDRVIRILLKRHGASWRRINCSEFLLGVGKDSATDSSTTDLRQVTSKSSQPVAYRLVYVLADTWEPYSSKLRLGGTSGGQDADFQASIEEAWEKCNLLTLDGSDLRSYWTLLALNKLVQCIAEEEENHAEPHYHSFHPEPYPNDTARPSSPTELALQSQYSDQDDDSFKALRASKRFLLCHYFDYIGGASFGGLVAIMLGRLHMAICDCISEFETLGEEVFQEAGSITTYFRGKPKYDASKLEDFMETVAEKSSWNWYRNGTLKFNSKSRTCRTFVTAIESAEHDRSFRKVRVLRSYRDSLADRSPATGQGAVQGSQTSQMLVFDKPLALLESTHSSPLVGTAMNAARLDIGLVARATTTSPGYFEPLTLKGTNYRVMFEHGGFGFHFNPTLFGMREIDTAAGVASAGTIVSVGTTVKGAESRNILARSFEPERVHVAVDGAAKQDGFEYYRIDPDPEETAYHVSNMAPDEWEPATSQPNAKAGWKTRAQIETVFNRWLENPDVQNYFTECAQSLVGRRRLRVHNRPRWARFSTGTEFRCALRHQSQSDPCWSDSEEFMDHLKDKHQLEGKALDDAVDRVLVAYRKGQEANPQQNLRQRGSRRRETKGKLDLPDEAGFERLPSRGRS